MEIFSNPLIKNVALKQLKSLMKEKGLQSIVLIQDSTGEIDFKLLHENVIQQNEELKSQIQQIKQINEQYKTSIKLLLNEE